MSTLQTGKSNTERALILPVVVEQVGQELLMIPEQPSLCLLVVNALAQTSETEIPKWCNG